jgi:hypothetical protein
MDTHCLFSNYQTVGAHDSRQAELHQSEAGIY